MTSPTHARNRFTPASPHDQPSLRGEAFGSSRAVPRQRDHDCPAIGATNTSRTKDPGDQLGGPSETTDGSSEK
ncbi:hypothetical protein GCM10007977_002540 [Dactylosporangium sucinum]|uniref:Uncharacterized protein n=1 Tax=Dactylosporangium sucinum TaxID=1424081 RepID=A0A917T0P4_9ACTN|nr:hypothetical protein GCM10007977_002540 [Dactylosporangium sucinum]